MLVNLCDYKQSVTLIANSGVQFLDFGLTPQESAHYGRFVRKTANGPLLRLDFDLTSGRYTLPGRAGGQPEVVKPESTQTLHYSLDVLDGIWLPCRSCVLIRRVPLLTGRITGRAFRYVNSASQIAPETHTASPSPSTVSWQKYACGVGALRKRSAQWHTFCARRRDEEVADFLDQTWIDGWLRESFLQYASQVENRPEQAIQQALRSFEYQAHWLNLLTLLGEQLTVPEVKFVTHTLSTPAIPVDLILDVGNTHTCGVLIEDHGDANDGLRQTAELQVRSLSEPQYLNDPLFTSRVEFSEARFGKQHFSVESGRDDAFVWPSIVRVGDEARALAMQRVGTEGSSGISSPRRYLWDETPPCRTGVLVRSTVKRSANRLPPRFR